MNNPELTIAIPTYNREEFLKQCLDSIKNQTFTNYKVLVFDNCSNYDIEALINKYGDRFELIKNDKNIGNLGNFSKIFSFQYETPYLLVFHDDDVIHPDYVNFAIKELDKNKDIVWAGGRAKFIKSSKKMFQFKKINDDLKIFNKNHLLKLIFKDYDLAFDSIIYRVQYIKSIEYYQKIYQKWCDRPYIIELIENKNILILNSKIINYRIHDKQDSQYANNAHLENWWNLIKFYENLSKDNKLTYCLFRKWVMQSIFLSLKSFYKTKNEFIHGLFQKPASSYISFRYLSLRSLFYFLRNIIK